MAFSSSGAIVLHTENLLSCSTLRFTDAVPNIFHAIIATHVLAVIMGSKLCGWTFVYAHVQLSRVCLPHVYP